MRKIDLIVIHCSATCENRPFTGQALEAAKDTRTEWQRHSLRVLVRALLMDYPEAKVAGHRDLSPDLNNNGEVEPMEWTKQCPCFEVKKEKW